MTPNKKILSIIGEGDGWLRRYLDLMVDTKDEMPLPFHLAAAVSVLGQAVGKDCYTYISSGKEIRPNLNAILFSPAGRARRSEGTKTAAVIAKMAGVNVFGGKVTPEGLLDELEERCQEDGVGHALLYVDELGILLNSREYMKGMIQTLTDLLTKNSGYEERTRGSGKKFVIDRLNLSALFTTDPSWFFKTIPEAALNGGFLSRFLAVYLPDREVRHINALHSDEEVEMVNKRKGQLAQELELIKESVRGYIKPTAEANEWLQKWYEKNEKATVLDRRLDPQRNRRPANLLRLSLLLAVSGGEKEVGVERFKQALAVIEYFDKTLESFMGVTDALKSPIKAGELEALLYMEAKGGEVTHQSLMKHLAPFLPTPQERKTCLIGAVEKGVIEQVGVQGVWPPKKWRLVK